MVTIVYNATIFGAAFRATQPDVGVLLFPSEASLWCEYTFRSKSIRRCANVMQICDAWELLLAARSV